MNELEYYGLINGGLCDLCPYVQSTCGNDYSDCVNEYMTIKYKIKNTPLIDASRFNLSKLPE